jgi:hypothetical protein
MLAQQLDQLTLLVYRLDYVLLRISVTMLDL